MKFPLGTRVIAITDGNLFREGWLGTVVVYDDSYGDKPYGIDWDLLESGHNCTVSSLSKNPSCKYIPCRAHHGAWAYEDDLDFAEKLEDSSFCIQSILEDL